MGYILALDQGTTSSRSILYNTSGEKVAVAQQEFTQYFPRPGWVEHDPVEIWTSQLATARDVLKHAGVQAQNVAAIGITNQRETIVLWDRKTGTPVAPAIVWQDRRTADFCQQLKAEGFEQHVRATTGLVCDPYFSGTKLHWLLEHVDGARQRAQAGELLAGTIDSWLLYNLTGGRVHATDYSNASRTMLYDIQTLQWDANMLERLAIPGSMLPRVFDSSGHFGDTDTALLGAAIPVMGIAGDQQAALFGQLCFTPGQAKNTYGTGCFMLMQTGQSPVFTDSGLLTTLAWGRDGQVVYALEGSVFIAGAAIQWLRDGLGIIGSAPESGEIAASLQDNGDVYLVPAFAGLGTPHWDPTARGVLIGLTRGTHRAHLVRAALEAIAFQSREALDEMQRMSGITLSELRVDGGAVANDFLMQFQADLLGVPVMRPDDLESTARGAAYLAGLAASVWDEQTLHALRATAQAFAPAMEEAARNRLFRRWQQAVERAKGWA